MPTQIKLIARTFPLPRLITCALAIVVSMAATAAAEEHAGNGSAMMQMDQIKTQAQAEMLKPGDSMAMTCTACKDVMIQKVTTDQSHVKMMTVGEKMVCSSCGGTVEVVATGKGSGKNAEVKHVCTKCGDDAMFCVATKPGSGGMKDMDKDKK